MPASRATRNKKEEALRNKRLYFSVRERQYSVPSSMVDRVERQTPLLPVPFSPPLMTGLAFDETGFTPVFRLASDMQEADAAHPYFLRFKTDKGLICIEIDHVDSEKKPHAKDCEADILALLDAFDATNGSLEQADIEHVAGVDIHTIILESDGDYIAIPSDYVMSVHPVDKTLPLQNGKDYEVIASDLSGTFAAASLSRLRHPQATGQTENWILHLNGIPQTYALTVARVLEIRHVPAKNLSRADYSNGQTFWFNDDKFGLVQLLRPEDLTNWKPNKPSPAFDTVAQEAAAAVRQVAMEECISAEVGTSCFTFPNDVVASVLGKIKGDQIFAQADKGRLPVYDFRTGLSTVHSETDPVAISLNIKTGKAIALVDRAITAAREQVWFDLPTLPSPIARLSRSLRLNHNRLDFLLHGDALSPSSSTTLLRDPVGWIDDPGTS